MTLTFVSFGSDRNYELLSRNILGMLGKSYPGSKLRLYGAGILPPKAIDYARRHRRGFGYWIWKPITLQHALKQAGDGEIVLYVDGRCGMRQPGKPVAWLDDFIARPDQDVTALQMDHPENVWTTADLMDALGADGLTSLTRTGQYSAGSHAWRANDRTRHFVSSWLRFMTSNLSLCRDEPSRLPNHPDFKENRHDQSVFSIRIKQAALNGSLSVLTISSDGFMADNLLQHRYRHPRRWNLPLQDGRSVTSA